MAPITPKKPISRLLGKFLPVPISLKEPLLRERLSYSSQITLIMSWMTSYLSFYFIWTFCKTPNKIKISLQIMTSSRTPTHFSFFNIFFICVLIWPKVAISPKMPDNTNLFVVDIEKCPNFFSIDLYRSFFINFRSGMWVFWTIQN